MYEIILSADASHFYERCIDSLARKLNRCFDPLARDPHGHPNVKRLTGELKGLWRFWVGDWRVVYRILEADRKVVVVLIAHRSEVYR